MKNISFAALSALLSVSAIACSDVATTECVNKNETLNGNN
jgi:hypothetical protein